MFDRARAQHSTRINERAPSGPILDVGAGEGVLVDALRARGRDAQGLDPYTQRDDFLKVDASEIPGRWAAVVFWHSLEHLPEPMVALRSAARALKQGGLLVIAVPNAASLQARFFGDRWFPLDLPRHLVHIPAKVLLRCLNELGFEIERVSYYRGGQVVFGWLHGLVGSISARFDLYDALRIPEARSRPMSLVTRLVTILLGVILFPLACIMSVAEIATKQSGTLYVEARLGKER